MPVFHLQPAEEGLADPAWTVSWYQGSCHVVARDAEAARRFAGGAFTIPVCPGGAPPGCDGPPWSQPHLVTVRELHDLSAEAVGPVGSVVAAALPIPALPGPGMRA